MNEWNEYEVRALTEMHIRYEDKVEIPCKDMDLDCLPDEQDEVPFGSYRFCYAFDQEKGACPFLPMHNRNPFRT